VTPSEPQFYGLSIHFQLLSTSCRQDAVTFRYWPVSSSQRGTLTLLRTFTFKRTSPQIYRWVVRTNKKVPPGTTENCFSHPATLSKNFADLDTWFLIFGIWIFRHSFVISAWSLVIPNRRLPSPSGLQNCPHHPFRPPSPFTPSHPVVHLISYEKRQLYKTGAFERFGPSGLR